MINFVEKITEFPTYNLFTVSIDYSNDIDPIGKIIFQIYNTKPICVINHLLIRKQYRQFGYGKMLLKHILDNYIYNQNNYDIDKVYLNASPIDNGDLDRLVDFYKGFNFKVVEVGEDYRKMMLNLLPEDLEPKLF